MKENNINTANVNYNIWKDKFLPKGKDPSDDYLPPELKTYCQVVDGISRDNNINLLVVPIYVPDKQNDGKNIGQTIGGNIYLQCKELMTEKSNNEYYSNINEKYKDLVDKEQSFGVIYVYHNKYCIKHCDGFVYHKNKDDKYERFSSFGSHMCFPLPIGCVQEEKHLAQPRQFYFSDDNFYRDFFSCRTVALQFIISLMRDNCKSIKGLNDNLRNDDFDPFVSLPEDFVKYAQVDIELLARLLCIFDKIRENKCQLDKKDVLWEPQDYLIKYSDNNELKNKLSEKITQFNISEEEIKQKAEMLKKDVYRQNKYGKLYNVGLAKLGAEWYAKYAGKKFLKEHNDIIKNYNQEHNTTDDDSYDSAAYCYENLNEPDRKGALATIDETYNKIIAERKIENNNNIPATSDESSDESNNDDKDMNNENPVTSNKSSDKNNNDNKNMNNEDNNSRNFFKKIDNNELNGEDNKEETKKLKTSSNEENNKNAKSDEENNKNTKLVDVDDKNISEKSHDITDKQQEATDTTGNRCWPFGWCSSCNGCAVFNNEKQNEINFRQNT